MRVGALQPYEGSLLSGEPIAFCTPDGQVIDLDIDRWLAPADTADATVLARCVGPVLDVGCGPGRFIAALMERNTLALGVDLAATAVAMTRGRGLLTLHRCIFSKMPAEGRWPTVLLMDGNIGIGGDPRRLLARVGELLAPGGTLLLETDPDERADEVRTVRFCQHGRPIGPAFPWARVGLQPLYGYATEFGYRDADTWRTHGRTFVALRR